MRNTVPCHLAKDVSVYKIVRDHDPAGTALTRLGERSSQPVSYNACIRGLLGPKQR
jgi:hypothetical protein